MSSMGDDDPPPDSPDASGMIYSLPRVAEIPDPDSLRSELGSVLALAGDAPVAVYLVEESLAALAAVEESLPDGRLRTLRRCDELAFDLWQRP